MVKRHGRLVVVITGANRGIGFAICQRLLLQLSRRQPPDAEPQPRLTRLSVDKEKLVDDSEAEYDGLTLILACRSSKKAASARADLLRTLDEEIEKQQRNVGYDDYAEEFRKNLQVVFHPVDLGDVKSVFEFSRSLVAKYPYVSHLICNAGIASIRKVDYLLATRDILLHPIQAVTNPDFKLQHKGIISTDGLGWVWQCNVFGHYIMFRCLEDHLARYRHMTQSPARVIWSSSLEARASSYDPKDWQNMDTEHSYEASKYQIDLLVGCLEAQQAKQMISSPVEKDESLLPVRHFLTHPGIVMSGIAASSVHHNVILVWLTQLVFLYVRFLGSTNHVMTCHKAAFSVVHLAIASLSLIPIPAINADSPSGTFPSPFKFGSQTGRFGGEYVDASEVPEWDTRWQDGLDLLDKCENLYQKFSSEEKEAGRQ